MTVEVERRPSEPAELPPALALRNLLAGSWRLQAIAVAARLGVADHLLDGAKTAEELAPLVDARGTALHRLMRALAGEGLFRSDDGGRFSLTPTGRLLTSDAPDSLRHLAMWIGCPLNWHAWEDLQHAVQHDTSAFEHQHGRSFFEVAAEPAHAASAAAFNGAMSDMSRLSVQAVLAAYDFGDARRIVDVGGGHGTLLRAILGRHEQAQGVLFDLPEVVRGVTDCGLRLHAVAGDMFVHAPPDGDIYILKHVLHDWSDARALDILRPIRTAMCADSRLLVMEMVLPDGDAPHAGKLLDLEMLVMTSGGRERTAEEFRDLLAQAGLRVTRVVPTAGPMVIVEAQPAD